MTDPTHGQRVHTFTMINLNVQPGPDGGMMIIGETAIMKVTDQDLADHGYTDPVDQNDERLQQVLNTIQNERVEQGEFTLDVVDPGEALAAFIDPENADRQAAAPLN